jgi:hypothetical protein
MGTSKCFARMAVLSLIATCHYAAEKRYWKEGTLISVETITRDKGERRYECVVSDGVFSYTIEYERPIKAPVHRPIKFVVENDTLILLDADGKERPAHIEKRERVLYDSPDRFK